MDYKVSIIIPCRNEEKFIGKCLDSIIAQDYPKDKLEVLVVDGLSEDRTREIVGSYALEYEFINLLDNHKKIVPTALNTGIRAAKGDIIIRIDAHNTYENEYISKCIWYLKEYNADNVGGIWVTLPGADTIIAKSIALALSSSFGVGNAYFRIGAKEPRYVDTVPFGCYKKEVFKKIGFFNEDLVRDQDEEFNLRLTKIGGKILLVPDIVSYYCARDSLLKLWRLHFQYGYFKPLVTREVGMVITRLQLIPPFFVASFIITGVFSFILKPFLYLFLLILSLYLSATLASSIFITIKKTNSLKYIFTLPVVFATIHFSYGLGYLKGCWDFILLRKHKRKKIKDVPLTR